MAHKGGLNNFGETAARRALRENTVAVTDVIQRHLAVLPRYLKQTRFMTESQWDDVASTTHSNAHKANDYMRAVESKVDSGNNPDRGREWLKELIVILMRQDIGEYVVAQDMAKVYIEHADSCTDDFAFFKQIAHQQASYQSTTHSSTHHPGIIVQATVDNAPQATVTQATVTQATVTQATVTQATMPQATVTQSIATSTVSSATSVDNAKMQGHKQSSLPKSSLSKPDLIQLKRLNVPREVNGNFKDFGIFLLNDGTGAKVNNIARTLGNYGDPAAIVTAILEQWLAGKGIPVTWDNLIQTLKDCELNALAETVELHLQQ